MVISGPAVNPVTTGIEQTSLQGNQSINKFASQVVQTKCTLPKIPPQKPLPQVPQKTTLKQTEQPPKTGIQAETQRLEAKSESVQENASTTPSREVYLDGTTITKEISSGQHPHLDEETNKAVQTYFNPEQKEVNKDAVNNLISSLINDSIIDGQGKINFEKLGLDKNIIKKAGIEGKIFQNENGEFDFKITGKCSEEAKKCMQALKDKLEPIAKNVKININPEAVGPLSVNDQHILANGGQIQYRLLPNGETMKLTLDPSKNNGEGALRIDVYEEKAVNPKSTSGNIPLKVVFEGQELNGKKVGPFLANWRGQQLFEKSVIHENITNFIPGIHRWDRFDGSNENDVNRIQAQDTLWNAVNEYLKASVETTGGHFEANNRTNTSDVSNTSAGVNTSNGEDHQSESYSISSENNPSATASTIQENNSSLKGDQETIFDLVDSSKSANFDIHVENKTNVENLGSTAELTKTKIQVKINRKTKKTSNNYVELLKAAKEMAENMQNIANVETSPTMDDVQEFLHEGAEEEKKYIKATKRDPKSMSKDHKELIKASRDLVSKMKDLAGLGDKGTIDESSNINPNTAAIENPGQKLLEEKRVALKTQFHEIQQDLSSKWSFRKPHDLTNLEVFGDKIKEFNNNIKNETYDSEKAYWDKFTSWYAKTNGGSPVVKK